jgi:hypothetical protein
MKAPAVILCLLAVAVGARPLRAAPDVEIGAVLAYEYSGATGVRLSGEERRLFFDLPVFSAERVDTGAGARTVLAFLDDTRLQRKQGEAAISFTRGLFRFVTGEMRNKDGFALRTPSATLAVRGTVFILFVAGDGRTVLSVIDGVVEMRPCDGTIHVVVAGESAVAAGDCTESGKSAGRLTPRDRSVDEDYSRFGQPAGRRGDGSGTTNRGGGSRSRN